MRRSIGMIPLFLFMVLPAMAAEAPPSCQTTQELCTISGAAGQIVQCPLRLASAKASLPTAAALQFKIAWDASRAKIKPFEDTFCWEGTCYPIQHPTCDQTGCTMGSLDTGHTLSIAPQNFSAWQGQGVMIIVNMGDPTIPLTSAYMNATGAPVGTDTTFLTASFELLQEVPGDAPVSVQLSEVAFASAEAVTMPFTFVQLPNDRLFVTDTNTPPVANAGPDQIVAAGSQVVLDGNTSCDPFDSPLSYQWTQVSGPTASLSNAQTAQPTFTAPMAGSEANNLVFELTVTDQGGLTTSDTVVIRSVLPADINNSGAVDLADAILALRIVSGFAPPVTIFKEADISGDKRIGIEEALHALQKAAQVR